MYQRLQEVRDVTDVPLVLHGGSGIPDDMIQTAIEIGIRKINVATEIRMAYVEGLLSGSANGDYYAFPLRIRAAPISSNRSLAGLRPVVSTSTAI